MTLCKYAKSEGGMRAVSCEPKTSGSEMPPNVTLMSIITPEATAPAASPAANPVQKRIFRRKSLVFMIIPFTEVKICSYHYFTRLLRRKFTLVFSLYSAPQGLPGDPACPIDINGV